MSCSNNPTEKKTDKEEMTFLSSPVHDYVKLIALVFIAMHLGSITSRYGEIGEFAQQSLPFSIFLIFCFCYINSTYKLEFSIVCTIAIVSIFYIIKMLKNQK
jgi:hypothetical protein